MTTKIIQWNVNGCKIRNPEIKRISLETKCSLLCLQETHFRPDDEFRMSGFGCLRKDVITESRTRGGVAIFTKS